MHPYSMHTRTGTQIWNGSKRQRVKEGSKAIGQKGKPDLGDSEKRRANWRVLFLSKSLSRSAGGWQVMAGAHDCCVLGSPLGRTEGGPARLPWGSEGQRVCPRAGVCVQTYRQ